MKLFLSSWDPQGFPPELRDLVGPNRRCAVSANACDAYTLDARAKVLDRASRDLGRAGFDPVELDLRVVRDSHALLDALTGCGLLWFTGGNAFVLRDALARTGLDRMLPELLADGQLAYGGASAGAIVAGSSLRGVELVDPLADLESVGGGAPIWDGMGLVRFAIVPHVETGGPMRQGIDALRAELQSRRAPFRELRDGESLVVDGPQARIVDHRREAELFLSGAPVSVDTKHDRN